MGEYKGKDHFAAAESKEESFKKGGKIKKKSGGAMKGKKDMKCEGSKCSPRADRPARKSGGAVFSSAASGTPRGKASHY